MEDVLDTEGDTKQRRTITRFSPARQQLAGLKAEPLPPLRFRYEGFDVRLDRVDPVAQLLDNQEQCVIAAP